MRVLVITNMYPGPARPAHGTFVKSQVDSLRSFASIRVVHIDRARLGTRGYGRVREQVSVAISQERPDVVHAMNGGALALLTASAIGRLPFVVSYCGSDLLGDPQRSFRRRLFGAVNVYASKLAALRADAIIVKSAQLGARVPRIVRRARIHIIPNGVDMNRFAPLDQESCRRELDWDRTPFHVLFTGDPDSRTKGLDLADAAVSALMRRGVRAVLHVMRGVPNDRVPIWLNAADVLLVSSLHEGSPNIVKEALACECPIVCTDVGDVRERILGIAGCYIAPGRPESLADGLEAVYLRRRRLTCREVLLSISLANVASRVMAVYRQALGPGSQGRADLGAAADANQ